jgi:pyridoxine 5-phosphate synthase
VPERRSEVTTEGGLDAAGAGAALGEAVAALAEAGCRVSLFIDPDPRQVEAAARVGAPVVEFHTGTCCEAPAGTARAAELERLRRAAALAHGLGVECHAGHGLSYATARPVAAIPEVVELNIGHFLVGEAVFLGLAEAIRRMREVMDAGRRDLARPKAG